MESVMLRKGLSLFVLAFMVILPIGLSAQAAAPAQPAAPTAATPESAAAFIGDWTLEVEGPNGPGTFALSVKAEAGKVTGAISSQQQTLQAITDISTSGSKLILRYVFDYQGMPVSAAITLTPGPDKVAASLDFADGAYLMTGTATKKQK
jgi:hypothetical protein